jgi:hypothetical protein
MHLVLSALSTGIVAAALAISAVGLFAAIAYRYKLHRVEQEAIGLDRTKPPRPVRVTLVLPLTGPAATLDGLVQALERQSLTPRRLVVAVESERDPAHVAAHRVARSAQLPVEIVIAGEARHCGQKCRNQIAGLRRVDADDDAVVLLDGDIAPTVQWLATAVRPLTADLCDISTGYRWIVPAPMSPGGHVAAAIDRTIALLPRPSATRMAWGGTLALSRQALSAVAPEATLGATLSDDCAIGDRALSQGLRLRTERRLLVPTPLATSLAQTWAFGRRQYQVIRICRPALYLLALGCMLTRVAAWGVLAAGMAGSGFAAAMIVLGLATYAGQQLSASRLGLADGGATMAGQLALSLALPLVDLMHASMILGALQRHVRWGHVTYKAAGADDITVIERRPWPR